MTASFTSHQLKRLDAYGASLSFLCALHCALHPLLLAVLPLVGLGFFLDERLEWVFLAGAILLATGTLVSGWRHHRQPYALPLLGLAVTLLVLGHLVEPYEVPLAVAGALGIMSAHLLNLGLHRRFHHAGHGHDHKRAGDARCGSG